MFAGSDNIRDAWSPLGDGDALSTAARIAWRQGFASDQDLELAFALVTGNAARVLGVEGYGLHERAAADLVAVRVRPGCRRRWPPTRRARWSSRVAAWSRARVGWPRFPGRRHGPATRPVTGRASPYGAAGRRRPSLGRTALRDQRLAEARPGQQRLDQPDIAPTHQRHARRCSRAIAWGRRRRWRMISGSSSSSAAHGTFIWNSRLRPPPPRNGAQCTRASALDEIAVEQQRQEQDRQGREVGERAQRPPGDVLGAVGREQRHRERLGVGAGEEGRVEEVVPGT